MNGRLAFLFLTIDDLNQHNLWERFFKGADSNLFSVYVHPKFPDRVTQSLLLGHLTAHVVDTYWAHISQIKALNHLLEEALSDDENAKFIYCSESCIPLYDFASIYKAIMADDKGFIHHYPRDQERWKYIKDPAYIEKESFLKMCAQGWVFNRELARSAVQNDHTELFEKMKCPTEHYYINLFQHLKLDLEGLVHNRRLTFFNWDESTHGGQHPKTYEDVTEEDINRARQDGFLFFRKVAPNAHVPVEHILS
jgi:hypothetical protein